ncbi:MAG TPA: molybdopterin-dependent oxidoreductase [Candidatus Didemnitutus sp.]|nr:molybdopterin-dependent oxidoreductase [Candidatus Didemnitutus sp.]
MRALRLLAWFLVLGPLSTALFSAESDVRVTGPAGEAHYTISALAALPQSDCTVTEAHGGGEAHFSGVPVRELLLKVGLPVGEALRGKFLRMAVLVRCADGYAVVFTLTDFDPAFSERNILLALRRNGAPLSDKAGPFQLIVPGDKRPARWARQVVSIEIVTVGDPVPAKDSRP